MPSSDLSRLHLMVTVHQYQSSGVGHFGFADHEWKRPIHGTARLGLG
jgi:hypothetical protein